MHYFMFYLVRKQMNDILLERCKLMFIFQVNCATYYYIEYTLGEFTCATSPRLIPSFNNQ